jgi:hypothetical protein
MDLVIKLRRMMRWLGHVARMGRKDRVEVVGGKARGKEATKKTKTCGCIILGWIS